MATTKTFRQAFKMNVAGIATLFLPLIPLAYLLYPINSPVKVLVVFVYLVGMASIAVWLINKNAKSFTCQNCSAELYWYCEQAVLNKLKVNYCPVCGSQLGQPKVS